MLTDAAGEGVIGPLKIEALANGGKGIAREQGRVIFIADTFPGDLVRCRVLRSKKSYAEAELVELLQASPLRRVPPCPVAGECGGCQWQQLPYAAQLEWKQRLFKDTLVRHAGAASELVRPIIPAADEWHYRSRVQVKCFLAGENFLTGFFRPKSRYVVDIESCPLMDRRLNRLLSALRQLLSGSRHAANIPQLDLAVGDADDLRVVVHYLGSERDGLVALLLPLAEKINFDLAIQSGRKQSLRLIRGSGELTVRVDQPELSLKYLAGGFAQVNPEQNRRLLAAAISAADLGGCERILDLYCGMGNFSLPLARRADQLIGIENYAPAIKMAQCNAAVNGIGNASFYAMPAELALQRFRERFDLLLLDPPRSGAYQLAKQLSETRVKKILYVSCDPQTLARDLKVLLNSGYQLESSQAFDMFPQTHHIESLTVLGLKNQ